MRPRISILLPAHNAGPTLDTALRSVQRQSIPRWECVVIDDGSTDRTRAIAERFATIDPRFRLISRAHAGLVASLNLGVDECRGDAQYRGDMNEEPDLF